MKIIDIINSIKPANAAVAKVAREKLDNLTKPRGSLGVLEDCAARYVSARGDINAKIANPTILTFAADHGIADEGVSAFPQSVTTQMLANFANNGAAINVLSRHAGAKLKVIDVGAAGDCSSDKIINRKIARGTANFAKGPAMTDKQCEEALNVGVEIAKIAIEDGATLICTGDMGIANTTSSSALYSIFLGISGEDSVGRGTGIDDEKLRKKISVVNEAVSKYSKLKNEPMKVLAAVGGLEIAGICGAILGSASMRVPVIVDGFISGAAAITAIRLNKYVADYCFFSHLSAEAGHSSALSKMGVRPLLNLELRLGEG
ncbi:MAG TPA: nicotinate-nucleotide--dimethylbenzimidazole phosphoribosyltransferase, partial [Victivallales bacterium]|nr:nicotinate-nucleotide--dimethylbenzimidazole phosphoribosyltransferase [Victivallales bacterium]